MSCVTSIPTINGYCSFASTNNPLQNDGVIIYIKDELSFTVEEPLLQNCNSLLIKIERNDTAILAVYRSPSYKNVSPFLLSLNQTLEKISNFKNISLVGDLNLDLISESPKSSVEQYLTLTAYHGLSPTHYLVTRDDSGTCIDHALLKSTFPSITIVPQSTITDHKTVILCLKKPQSRHYASSNRLVIDQEGLSDSINKINFDHLYNLTECNAAMDCFINSLKTALENNTAIVPLSCRKKIIKPWITPGLLRCMRNRDKLHKKSKASPDDLIIKSTYIRYRNFCCKILKKVKRSYERELIQKAGNDSKQLWDTIKNITNTSKVINFPKELLTLKDNPQKSVDYINKYFSSVGETLANKITSSQPHINNIKKSTILSPNDSFVLIDTDEEEVNSLILTLKNKCSVGHDGITNKLLKDFRHQLVPHLTYIFNMCLANGIFPYALKRSQISPIHKGGDRNHILNYRPISILPSISKLLEKIINSRLIKYLEDKNIISDNQFGFRKGKSTDDAVSTLTNFIAQKLDEGKKCIAIFLDLAKAFDTVSVPILIYKLQKIGVRGTQLALFSDYLTGRSQCVKVGSHTSTNLSVTYGVPQGSILGPTLFLIYINDLLCLDSFHGKIISYADDTALIFTAKSWNETYLLAQNGLNTVRNWLKDNILTLNSEKTKYLAFSIRNCSQDLKLIAHDCQSDPSSDYNCQCKPLERVSFIKYLGVIIDSNLSFKQHIFNLSKKVRKLIYVFKNLRHVVPRHTLKQIYYALCQSLISYCISSWGGAPKTTLKQLEVSQRAILKICSFKPIIYPTKLLYEYCQVFTVRQLFLCSIILKQHSMLQYNPKILSRRRWFTVCRSSFKPKTMFIHRFFNFLGTHIYNKINKILNIYPMNIIAVKKTITPWIQSLTYDETEDLLVIQQ